MPILYAKRGERVTCMKGHHVATFNRDVEQDTVAHPSALNWVQPPPKMYDPIETSICRNCGLPYARCNPEAGVQLFIDGKWREEPIDGE